MGFLRPNSILNVVGKKMMPSLHCELEACTKSTVLSQNLYLLVDYSCFLLFVIQGLFDSP